MKNNEAEKNGYINKLDEFIDRQGIKSAELCLIIDGVECDVKELENKVQALEEQLVYQKAITEDYYFQNKELENKVQILKEALEFYSKPFSQGGCYIGSIDISHCHGNDCEAIGAFSYGGKRAREALEAVE